jgi:Pyridoxal/pyridoxine/pyridoxamine kinase
MQKRTLAIHDISCFGRCSLTVALPILSAAGIETPIIPTAILSTHTGGFTDFTFRDLSKDIMPIINHWISLDLRFDSIYSGYLGSVSQIDLLISAASMLSNKNNKRPLVFVDPVMADHGSLYKSFPESFPMEMKRLCQHADIIVPNITEACLLTNIPYKEGPYTKDYIHKLLSELKALGNKQIVITGIYFNDKQIGAVSYDCTSDSINYHFTNKINGSYHGTGDIFSSVLLSGILNNFSLSDSVDFAAQFTYSAIARTIGNIEDIRFGVNFEEGLYELASKFQKPNLTK